MLADFAKIRDQVSILTAASRLGIQVFDGNKVRCCNTARHTHGDKSPSVSLIPSRGAFKCWVCDDVRGDVIDFVRLWGGLDWKQAVDFLGTCGADVELPELHRIERVRPALTESHIEVMGMLVEMASRLDYRCRDYLARRCIDPDLADDVGVRCIASPSAMKPALWERIGKGHPGAEAVFNDRGNLLFHMHRLLFPYWNEEGKVVYIQGRDIYGKASNKELAAHVYPTVPWVVPGVFDHQQVFLAEGVIDNLTLLTKGRAAVGLPGARTWQESWANYFEGKDVLPALDGDLAGRRGTEKVISTLAGKARSITDLALDDGEDVNALECKGLLDQAIEGTLKKIP